MARNVIILGAGFSYSAGIPLLGGFVDKMMDYFMRGKANGTRLSEEDTQVFARAREIIDEMDEYHARVSFDSTNIEDILSILSFNVLAGNAADREKQIFMNRAIARTIELSCNIAHIGPGGRSQTRPPSTADFYLSFWQSLLLWRAAGNTLPTIITFNYDLVIERLFFQLLCGTDYESRVRVGECFKFNYHYDAVPQWVYKLEASDVFKIQGDRQAIQSRGTILNIAQNYTKSDLTEIELLKLHGSLNFPSSKDAVAVDDRIDLYNITKAQPDPYILPPIFNKFTRDSPSEMWRVALMRLREASNVVIVGYSLPRTDIYMQYFLKAALGQNRNLRKVTVFDPLLHDPNRAQEREDMKNRYRDCFAKQQHRRLDFDLTERIKGYNGRPGSAESFLDVMMRNPQGILYSEQ